MSSGNAIDLPDALADWVTSETGEPLLAAAPHRAGASRSAWRVETGSENAPRSLFLLQDRNRGGGSARDAAVLRALGPTEVPVPEVVAIDADHGALLLTRLAGESSFPDLEDPAHREPIARHLMSLTTRLHGLDPKSLSIPHLALPATAEDCARDTLAQTRGALAGLGENADPFFAFALDWLEDHVPDRVERFSLVHSDMGPGNFLHEQDRITGIVDWEVAHFGDPMEDLAAIAIRDMATPVGDLAQRFAEYEAAGGQRIDLRRIHFYRALVLVRNSVMIGLGLAHPTPTMDVDEMNLYQTLLMRAATLVLCDNLGIERPASPDETDPGGPDKSLEGRATEHARRLLRLARDRRSMMGALYSRLPQPLEPS